VEEEMKLTLEIGPDTGYGMLHLCHTISDPESDHIELHTDDVEVVKEIMLRFVETSLQEVKDREKRMKRMGIEEAIRQYNRDVVRMVETAMEGGKSC
jgi:hypothetical protein